MCSAAILVVVGLLATGCPPDPTPNGNGTNENENDNGSVADCTTDDDCAEGLVCTGGQCVAGEAQWSMIHPSLPSAILSVQAVANGDVYAVGSDSLDGKGPYVLRYDGQNWVRLLTGLEAGNLWWVHEVTPGDIWMSGADRLVLRFDADSGTFDQMDAGEGGETLFGIWGVSADDVWVVGGVGTETEQGIILRYDGESWNEVAPEVVGQDPLATLFKIWGSSANDVWMCGAAGAIIHFDGMNYQPMTTSTGRSLFTIHSNADGSEVTAVGGFGLGGGEVRDSDGGDFELVTPVGANQMNGVNYGADFALAAGVAAMTLRQENGAWAVEDNGLFAFAERDFHAVWIDDAGNAWAVGGNLSIDPQSDGMIAFYGTADVNGEIVELAAP